MLEFFSSHNVWVLIPLAALVGWSLVEMVSRITQQWRRVRIAEIEASLKQQMIERGMSASEIERVLHASRDSAPEEVAECTP
jgi:hypothetical protein